MFFKALVARSAGIFTQVLLLMVSARVADSEGVGAFSLYATWLLFAAAIIDFGAAQYVLRESASSIRSGRDPTDIILGSMGFTTVIWLCLALLAEALVYLRPATLTGDFVDIARLSIISALPATWLSILGQALRAYSKPSISMLLLFAAAPLCSILIVGVYLLFGATVGWRELVTANIVGLVIAAAVALYLCLLARLQGLQRTGWSWPSVTSLASQYYASVLTILFVALPSFLLPFSVKMGEIGLFYVAFRVTTLLASVLDVVASIYAPKIAACFSIGDMKGVEVEFGKSLKLTRIFGIVLGVLLVAFGPWILSIFGPHFEDGIDLLRLQMLGRLTQMFTGITSYAFWMIEQPLVEGSLSLIAGFLTVVCARTPIGSPAVAVSAAVSLGYMFKGCAQYILLLRIFSKRRTAPV